MKCIYINKEKSFKQFRRGYRPCYITEGRHSPYQRLVTTRRTRRLLSQGWVSVAGSQKWNIMPRWRDCCPTFRAPPTSLLARALSVSNLWHVPAISDTRLCACPAWSPSKWPDTDAACQRDATRRWPLEISYLVGASQSLRPCGTGKFLCQSDATVNGASRIT